MHPVNFHQWKKENNNVQDQMRQASREKVGRTRNIAMGVSAINVPIGGSGLTLHRQEEHSDNEPGYAEDQNNLYRDSRMGIFEEAPIEGQDGELCKAAGYRVGQTGDKCEDVGSFESFVFGEVRRAIFKWYAESIVEICRVQSSVNCDSE
jgi:hypothetical protein